MVVMLRNIRLWVTNECAPQNQQMRRYKRLEFFMLGRKAIRRDVAFNGHNDLGTVAVRRGPLGRHGTRQLHVYRVDCNSDVLEVEHIWLMAGQGRFCGDQNFTAAVQCWLLVH